MKKKPWLVFGAIGIGAVLAGACGGDDDSNGTGGTTSTNTTSGGGSGGAGGTSPNTTTSPSTTTSPNTTTGTTSASTTGSGGAAGTAGAGGECGEAGAAGMAGAPPLPPSCDEIASRAFVGDDVDADDFAVSSPDFDNCEPMPAETTCDDKPFAESISPEVNWTEGPEGTLSYAITFTDVTILTVRDPADPTYNQGYHYVIWDIPADTLTLPANLSSGYQPEEIEGALQWSPFNDYGFMGPCPNFPAPACNPPPLNNDSYSFTVYAMPTATLEIPAAVEGQSFPRMMDNYLKDTALAAVEVRGTSNAQASSTETLPPVFDLPCPTEGTPPAGCLEAE